MRSIYFAVSLFLHFHRCQTAGYPRCGVVLKNRVDLGFAAGEKTNTVQHPWAVVILKVNKDDENKFDVHCSGALITPSHVISAGHCFSGKNPANSNLPIDKLTLAFGLDDINQLKIFLPIQFRKIRTVYPYESYEYPSSYFDVAVVELSEPVKLGPQTWPICLPDSPNQDQDHMMEDSAVLVGYGPETDNSTKVNQIKQTIEPTYFCSGLYLPENSAITKREIITSLIAKDLPNLFNDESVICASDPFNSAKGTCPGDSGAPLIKSKRDRKTFQIRKTLVAVLHGGLEKCDNSVYPAIYTRITTPKIWNWIMDDFVNKLSEERIEENQYETTVSPVEEDTHPIFSKVMITTGFPRSPATKTEILDLANGRSCRDLADFPVEILGAVGANLQGTPVVCGGSSTSGEPQKMCYGFNGRWQEYPSLKEERLYAAGIMNKKNWHVFGGVGGVELLKTSEIVNKNGVVVDGPALLTAVQKHAITSVNQTVAILSGGTTSANSASSKTFYYNLDTEIFTSGPTLLEGRRVHGSATIEDQVTKLKIPVVTGGWKGEFPAFETIDSTELLINGRWQKGPPLPNKLAAHSSLEINGDLFVFGGQDETGYPQSAIHQLTCSSAICRWSTVNQSLKVARPKLIAIPVPDIFCT